MKPDWIKKWDPNIVTLAREAAIRHKIDPHWVICIIQAESAGNPSVMRYEPNWRYLCRPEFYFSKMSYQTQETETQLQKFSYGLMQIMGSCAREWGFPEPLPMLLDPFRALEYGCKHLSAKIKKYPTGRDWIAAYNGGSPRKTPDGKYEKPLEEYVTKVVNYWNDINDL